MELFATAGTTLVAFDAHNSSKAPKKVLGRVLYDNQSAASSSPYLEAVMLIKDPATGDWHETGRTEMPNDQSIVSVAGLALGDTDVRLEVRGHRNLSEQVVAVVQDVQVFF